MGWHRVVFATHYYLHEEVSMSSVASRSTPTRDSARPEEDDALSDALGSASSHTVIIEGDVEVEVREEDEIDAAVVPFCDDAVGALEHEGHEITVWSLVCSPAGEVVCINCTGSHTSVSAALQRLLRKSGGGKFVPAEPGTWSGPKRLVRLSESYLLLRQPLPETRLKNYCLLARHAHILDGLKRPPDLPEARAGAVEATGEASGAPSKSKTSPQPRYVLGNAGAPRPPKGALYGHLKGMQVVCLPEWEHLLWKAGSRKRRGEAEALITPLPAIGLSAWKLDGDLRKWNDLVRQGRRAGWLPLPEALPDSTSSATPGREGLRA